MKANGITFRIDYHEGTVNPDGTCRFTGSFDELADLEHALGNIQAIECEGPMDIVKTEVVLIVPAGEYEGEHTMNLHVREDSATGSMLEEHMRGYLEWATVAASQAGEGFTDERNSLAARAARTAKRYSALVAWMEAA
jgi:hypothetical protein